jgi:hypothetical protein
MGVSDFGRSENRRGYLVEQGLEDVVIPPVYQNDVRSTPS